MSSLTEISISTRKLLSLLAVLFITYLFLKIIIGIGIQYWKSTHSIPVLPPDHKFEKLSSIKFTHVATSSSGFKFILENIEGRPPETTAAAKVYPMPKKPSTLLASERAKQLAKKLLFTEEPEIITPTYYRFTDPSEKLRTLEIDIINLNFKLKYDYRQNTQIFNHGQVMNKDSAFQEIKSFIQSNSLFDDSIIDGKITTDLLIFNSDSKYFQPASSLSNTNSLRINFLRNDLDNIKILPPQFTKSYNYVLFTEGQSLNTRIIEISYAFWPINFSDFGTYPLKSAASAWQDLLDGYAYIINVGNNTPDKIVIRKIYLAYYDSEEPQKYLQPIFVFEGDNDFVAYLPAIDPSWLE